MSKVLSISIAAYNVEDYLDNALQSLVAETSILDSLQIIVVNDGSTDNTINIASCYEKKYPGSIIVVDKCNGGYGSTINTSLAIATGKYFKLLDGDDWYDNNALRDLIYKLKRTEADLIVMPYYEHITSNKLIDRHREICEEESLIEQLRYNDLFFAMHELAVKTETLKRVSPKITEKSFYTDTEYVYDCIKASNTIARIDTPIYCYRLGLNGQSVSVEGIRKHYRDFITVSRKIYQQYESDSINVIKGKRELLNYIVEHITYNTYKAFTLLEEPKAHKKELQTFDQEISEQYPTCYKIGNRSKMIRLIRHTKFKLFGIISKYSAIKFQKENG